MTKRDALKKLRIHLAELFRVRFEGADIATYSKTQGFVDGYIQALSDLNLASDKEILSFVQDERSTAFKGEGSNSVPTSRRQIAADFA